MKKFLFIYIILIVLIIYLFMPHIVVSNNTIYLNVYDNIKVPSYKIKIFMFDSKKKAYITNNINNMKLGSYYINYNYGIVNKRVKVKVIDKEKPSIEFCGPKNINLFDNKDYKKYIIHDNYDKNIKIRIKNKKSKIIYILKDKSGNKNIIVRNIINKDTLSPLIETPSNLIINEGDSLNYQFNAIDNSHEKINVVKENIDTSKYGSYPLTLTATDKSGNTSSKTINVIVLKRLTPGVIYLTFDDGPSNVTTNTILDILRENGIKATFFVTNHGSDDILKRELFEGHSIGLHSSSHMYSEVYKSPKAFFDDLESVRRRVINVTGLDTYIIRFPGGSSNTVSKKYYPGIMSYLTREVEERGYRYFDWNIDSGDAEGKSKEYIYNTVTHHLSHNRPNVVLMHDIKKNTVDILPEIIKYAKENGYSFSRIEEYNSPIKQRVYN